jgi:replicative DNA helicase
MLAELQRAFMELKKIGRTTIIQLSQLNRNIEEVSRINNPQNHFPLRNDLFGSDSLYHASDYVMVLHSPEMLNIKQYGPNS